MSFRSITAAAFFALLLAMALCACSNDPSGTEKRRPLGKVIKAQVPPNTPSKELPAPPPKPTPPPLIEAKDPEDGKIEVFVPIIPENRKDKQKPEIVERENVFWRYYDHNGVSHVIDDPSGIPKAFRNSAEKIERRPPSPATPDLEAPGEVMDQGEAGTIKEGSIWQKREKACDAFRTKYKEAREKLTAASEAYAMAKNSPPECGTQALPGLNPTYDTDCETHWKNRVELLHKNEERAEKNLSNLQDEARRADVPPGCLR